MIPKTQIYKLLAVVLWVAAGFVLAFVIGKVGLAASLGLIGLGPVFWYLHKIGRAPLVALYTAIGFSFVGVGLGRYVMAPWGLLIDGFLVLGLVAFFFRYYRSPRYAALSNIIVYLMLAWMLYNIMQLFNPQARSYMAWFYAMRGVALYPLLTVVLGILLLRKPAHVNTFLTIWMLMSIVATLNGMRQLFFGVDAFEQAWLNRGAAVQHVLFGKLRIFSFYSDAGQCGAAQGHAFVVGTVLALGPFSTRRRVFFALAGLLGLYGMFISGTRGALAVPAAGAFLFLLLSKQFKIIVLGVLVAGAAFVLLKYTTIGQNVYEINRMRTALDPDDPSLQVRLDNQRRLSAYLADKPFGGGVGSAGSWGLRFSPNTFLAQTPTDSWYVRIWAEYGAVGLWLHLLILATILLVGTIKTWQIKNPQMQQTAMAMLAGTAGILLASYGNGVLGQMPTGLLVYTGWVVVFNGQQIAQQPN